MRRREFIALAGAAVAWPLAARAQQSALPLVGFLHGAESDSNTHIVTAFRNGFAELGYIEGRNAATEFLGPRAATILCPPMRPILRAVEQQ